MKKYVLAIAICSGLFLFMNACKHETTEKPQPTTTAGTTSTTSTTSTTATTGTPGNDSVCFNTQIQPLFNSSCAMSGCHDAITHADGYNLTTYAGIKKGIVAGDPTEGKIMKEIEDGKMPQSPIPPLTADQKALLTKWILEGALNRVCNDGCDPTMARFADGVNPIITTNCVGCHNNSLASGGVNLSGYNNIQSAAVSGKLLCSIQQNGTCSNMPKNGTKLNDGCIQLIENWVNAGAPNN